MSSRPVPPTDASSGARMEWMDTLRGVSILLVVLYHSFGFTYDHPETAPVWLRWFNDAFDPLRMPLMVFLSGMLVPLSLQKGTRKYVSGKLRNVLHPYLVWSAIMIVVLGGAAVLLGKPFDPSMVWKVFWQPVQHLWFLWFLLVYYAVALVTRRFNPVLVAAVAFAIAVLVASERPERLFLLMGYFMLGAATVRYSSVWGRLLASRWALAVAAVAFAALFILSLQQTETRYVPTFAPLVMAAAVGACIVARRVGSPTWLGGVRFLGKESLVFYVAHYPVILVALVLVRAAVPGMPEDGLFVVAVVVALGAGIVLAWATRRVPGASLLFRFGHTPSSRLPVGAA